MIWGERMRFHLAILTKIAIGAANIPFIQPCPSFYVGHSFFEIGIARFL